MQWLQVLHAVLATLPWVVLLWTRNLWVSVVWLAISLMVTAQWQVIGTCILNPIENEGGQYAVFVEKLAGWFKLPVEESDKGFTLVNMLSPSFAQMSRIAGALGL